MADVNTTQLSDKRIAKNTIMLYLRTFLTTLVGFYTSRVVLNVLGAEDYGIYGVVGGIVGMFAFLNASMAGATSRFLTFELGKGDNDRLAKTFSSALIVHTIIALIVLFVSETVGLWFLCNKLVIPEDRMIAAQWVFHLSILSSMLSITQVPYNACIISHEKMTVYSYVEILNVTLKLLIVFLISIGSADKLVLYAILMLVVSVIILLIYRIYCIRNFDECNFHWIWDKEYIMPMLSFSGWSLYYEGAFAFRQQGANFLLNMFCGLVYNAASGIATTVQGIVMSFSSNITMAFRPQVIKAYATQDYDNMNRLIRLGSKIASVLILAFTIPLIIKLDYILRLWLIDVPTGTTFMVKCLLIVNVVNTASVLLVAGIQATGKLKMYSSICGSFYLLSIGLMYILLRFGFDYTTIYLVILVTAFIVHLSYAIILKLQIPSFTLSAYYLESVLPVIVMTLLTFSSLVYIERYFNDSFTPVILFVALSVVYISLISFIIVLKKDERKYVVKFVQDKILKKINK